MTILGVDYGRTKIGLALGESRVAEPLKVIRISSWKDAFVQITEVCERNLVEKIVVGISENKMAIEQKEFAKQLSEATGLRVDSYGEGLTTKDAQKLSREAGIPKGKRRRMEDAFASALMLQSYLETQQDGEGS